MGALSPDGKVFWLSWRHDSAVYAISTVTGRLLAQVPAGAQPHEPRARLRRRAHP